MGLALSKPVVSRPIGGAWPRAIVPSPPAPGSLKFRPPLVWNLNFQISFRYRSTIQTEPGSRVAFEWETLELLFGQVERTLIYDPSDSEAHAKDMPYDYYGNYTRHRHLVGHFYLIAAVGCCLPCTLGEPSRKMFKTGRDAPGRA
jgi:hypothetical protein